MNPPAHLSNINHFTFLYFSLLSFTFPYFPLLFLTFLYFSLLSFTFPYFPLLFLTFLYFSLLNLQTLQSLIQKSNLERLVQNFPQTTQSGSSKTHTIHSHKSTQIRTQPANTSSLKPKKQPKTAPSNCNTTAVFCPNDHKQKLETEPFVPKILYVSLPVNRFRGIELTKVSVYVDDSVWLKFKAQVFEKHGSLRKISREVEELLRATIMEDEIISAFKKTGIAVKGDISSQEIKQTRITLKGPPAEEIVKEMRLRRVAETLPRPLALCLSGT